MAVYFPDLAEARRAYAQNELARLSIDEKRESIRQGRQFGNALRALFSGQGNAAPSAGAAAPVAPAAPPQRPAAPPFVSPYAEALGVDVRTAAPDPIQPTTNFGGGPPIGAAIKEAQDILAMPPDQQSAAYASARARLIGAGIPAQWLPEQYDQARVQTFLQRAGGTAVAPTPSASPLVDQIIARESAGNPTARNPRSSATGLGQFINGTWLDLIRRNRPDLAEGRSPENILAMRTDPDLSREMTAVYAQENAARLAQAGLPVTPGTQYLAHFAGPAGAQAILQADPSTPVARLLGPRAILANPFLRNMAAGDLVEWANRKMAGVEGGGAPVMAQNRSVAQDGPESAWRAVALPDGTMPPQGPPASPGASAGASAALPAARSGATIGGVPVERMIPVLMQAAASPNLPDSQRQMVNTLLQFALKDQTNQIQTTPDGDILAINPRTGQVQVIHKSQPKPMTVAEGAAVIDPRTGNVVYRGEPKQTDDLREYEAARKQGFQGTFEQWQVRMKEAGRQQITIDQRGESEYAKQSAKNFAEMNADIIKSAQSARQKLATLGQLETLLKDPNIYTGAGANVVAAAKRIGSLIGLPEDRLGVGPTDAVRAISNQFALELRNPSGGAGMPGALSDRDREFLQASVPGLLQTRAGNALLVEYMKRMSQRSIDVERLRQQYAAKNKALDEGFFRELADFADKNPLFPEAGSRDPAPAGALSPLARPAAPVRVSSPDEARRLPSGTRIILPDGSEGAVP